MKVFVILLHLLEGLNQMFMMVVLCLFVLLKEIYARFLSSVIGR